MTKITDSRTGVENQSSAAARNFDAARIATKRDVFGRWRRDAASHPPKLYLETHPPRPLLCWISDNIQNLRRALL
ncbi:MAG: hypothetical protein HOJ06_16645 [Rhodospirillaceae bacterium]|nr:hypothetical protein [Rhodospirillaceae bacterium]